MNVVATSIPDVLIIEAKVFGDARGFFSESFNQKAINETTGLGVNFLQDNHSRSAKGVLRGAVFDVAVDIRKGSPIFGKWEGIELTEDNRKQLWVPPGFAHGFVVLSDFADFLYKTTEYYAPAHERYIAWNDPEVGIDWPFTMPPRLSIKDHQGMTLRDAETL